MIVTEKNRKIETIKSCWNCVNRKICKFYSKAQSTEDYFRLSQNFSYFAREFFELIGTNCRDFRGD